jgi:deazaflavin-dependent oxidoreductase (nitroreductase family)
MPRISDRAKNLVPTLLLRSPLHRVMSGRYLEITFTGVRSARSYTTPVAYVTDGDKLLISTDSPWSRNISHDTPVSLRLRNRTINATARVVTDQADAARALRKLVDQIPGYAKAAELPKLNGNVSNDTIANAVNGTRTVIELSPREPT